MSLSGGAIAGIVIACLLGVAAIAIGVFVWYRWRQSKEDEENVEARHGGSPRGDLRGYDNPVPVRDEPPWSTRTPHPREGLSPITQKIIEEREARERGKQRQPPAHRQYGSVDNVPASSHAVPAQERIQQDEISDQKPKKELKGWRKKLQNFKDNLEGKEVEDDPELAAKVKELEEHVKMMRENMENENQEEEARLVRRMEKLQGEIADIRAKRAK